MYAGADLVINSGACARLPQAERLECFDKTLPATSRVTVATQPCHRARTSAGDQHMYRCVRVRFV